MDNSTRIKQVVLQKFNNFKLQSINTATILYLPLCFATSRETDRSAH